MHPLERRKSGQDLGFIIEHLVRESQALLFELDERRSYRHDITGVQLLNVRYVLIDRGHAPACRAQARWREAQGVKELPSRFVKLSYVPHDVHVSHVITVPRVHSTAIGKQSFGHEGSPVEMLSLAISCGRQQLESNPRFPSGETPAIRDSNQALWSSHSCAWPETARDPD